MRANLWGTLVVWTVYGEDKSVDAARLEEWHGMIGIGKSSGKNTFQKTVLCYEYFIILVTIYTSADECKFNSSSICPTSIFIHVFVTSFISFTKAACAFT